mmetsp:Transcript_48175/g.124311  ORF Transcript_48175/g.124311 Transcript_48175/m.124311 type:complete len:346 (-) Transcript_48175:58-1095(-)
MLEQLWSWVPQQFAAAEEVVEEIEDDYDPRKPEYITQASVDEIEESHSRLLEQQITKLEAALERRVHFCPQVAGHYEWVLDEMRASASLGQRAGLSRSMSAPCPQLSKLAGLPAPRRPRNLSVLVDSVLWEEVMAEHDAPMSSLHSSCGAGVPRPGEMLAVLMRQTVQPEAGPKAPAAAAPPLVEAPVRVGGRLPGAGLLQICSSSRLMEPATDETELHPPPPPPLANEPETPPDEELQIEFASASYERLPSKPCDDEDMSSFTGNVGAALSKRPRAWSEDLEPACNLLGEFCPQAALEAARTQLLDPDLLGTALVRWVIPGLSGLQEDLEAAVRSRSKPVLAIC